MRCEIISPVLLARMARHADPAERELALYTLTRDNLHRMQRAAAPTVLAARPAPPPAAPSDEPARTIYDAQHTEQLPGTKIRDEHDPATGDKSATDAYDGLGATFEFYLSTYGRHSIDDHALHLDATIHYGDSYDNAFWDGHQMVFGDGDGKYFISFTGALDVIGHELTHGVTQYTAGLIYHGQSGALNESISDVFGIMIKQYALHQTSSQSDWLIGAGILGPNVKGVALRSMAAPGTAFDDPVLGKDPQPATMADYVHTSDDAGGVHINSGIPNHAFYLAAQKMGGYSWEKAGQIWYDTLTGPALKPNATFASFAKLTVTAAGRGYNAGEVD